MGGRPNASLRPGLSRREPTCPPVNPVGGPATSPFATIASESCILEPCSDLTGDRKRPFRAAPACDDDALSEHLSPVPVLSFQRIFVMSAFLPVSRCPLSAAAAEAFGTPYAEVDPELRAATKPSSVTSRPVLR